MTSNNVACVAPQINETNYGGKNEKIEVKVNGVCEKPVNFRDIEMVRLIGQYLCDKGYSNAYNHLAKDSGISLEPQAATDLRAAILCGNWEASGKAIDELAPIIENAANLAQIRFLLLEQQFLELLEADDVIAAVTLLRNRITPLQPDQKRLQVLAHCLMCRTGEEVRAQAGGWSGTHGGSRVQLVDCVQRFIPAQTMLPPGRLETLVTEAVRSQLNACTFHNQAIIWPDALESTSLLQPHSCSIQNFPVYPVQTIDHRDTDLWLCQFSPDGLCLATAGKDANVDVWRVDAEAHIIHSCRSLTTTDSYIGHLCWSPNSKKLAVCCGDETGPIVVFDVTTRRQLCHVRVNDEDVYCAAAFFADNRKLAFGGMKGSFYVMDTEDDGRILATVEGYRVQSMAAILLPNPIDLRATLAGLTAEAPIDLEACHFSLDPLVLPDASNVAAANAALDFESLLATDQLLVADSLHRIRLYKFGCSNVDASATAGASNNGVRQNLLPQELDHLNLQYQQTAWGSRMMQTVFSSASALGAPPPVGSTSRLSISLPMRQTASDSTISSGTRQAQLFSAIASAISMTSRGSHSSHQTAHSQPRSSALATAHGGYAVIAIGGDDGVSVASSSTTSDPFHLATSGAADLSGSSGNIGTGLETTSSRTPSSVPAAVVARMLHNYSFVRPQYPSLPGAAGSSGLISPSFTSSPAGQQPQLATPGYTVSSTHMGSGAGLMMQSGVGGESTDVSTTTSTQATATSTSYSLLQHSTLIKEIHAIQSISISASGKRLAITLHKEGIHLRDLESRAMIQRFWGFKQDNHRLTSTIGGVNEDFVASGSEDGFLHIWHVSSENRPIHSAVAATARYPVECVHWNPTVPSMLASVNDEGEIRIWGPAKFANGYG